MASTTMHFGPEWMRTKPQLPTRAQLSPPSPPPPPPASIPSSVSTYSALVSPAPPPLEEKRDDMHPFRYSREEMLRIYKDGGGKLSLGLEVERWEGVVREVASEPVNLCEMGDVEKKLFATSINSDLRRRQSTDYLSPLNTSLHSDNRPRLSHNSSTNSPLRERFGGYMGKRRDSTDQPPLMIPRKLSHASALPLTSPREPSLPSPRTRVGTYPSFDGVFNGGDSWVARRKAAESLAKSSGTNMSESVEPDPKTLNIHEEEDEGERGEELAGIQSLESVDGGGPPSTAKSEGHSVDRQPVDLPAVTNVPAVNTTSPPETLSTVLSAGPPPGLPDLSKVEWSYLDPQGQEQGPFRADLMQKWFEDGYFTPDLLMKRVHADKEWTPLGELIARLPHGKLFLSPIPPPPSSAPVHTESPLQPYGIPADQNTLGRDGQLASARPFRTPVLESYLGNTTPSDSPSSSFSAGRYGSSDFSGGGIAPHPFARADASAGTRMPGFAPIRESQPAFTGVRKGSSYNEQPTEQLSGLIPSFATVAHQAPNSENFGASAAYHLKPAPWPTQSNNHVGPGFDGRPESMGMYPSFQTAPSNLGSSGSLSQGLGFSNIRNPQDPSLNTAVTGTTAFAAVEYGGSSDFGAHRAPQLPVRTRSTDQIPGAGSINSYTSFGGLAPGQQLTPSTSVQYTLSQEQQSSNSEFVQRMPYAFSTTSQPPWNTQPEVPIRRPGPFDAPHPTASNTSIQKPITPTHPSPWGRTSQPSQSGSQPRDPWLSAPLSHADDDWKEIPGPNSLTFSNVGQHNQQHQREQELSMNPASSHPKTALLSKPTPVQPRAETTPPIGNEDNARPAPALPRAHRKSGPQQPLSVATQVAPQATPPAPEPSPIVPQPKSAWPKEDDTRKAKVSGIALGLREIQEAEAKKGETRKAAEKERERAARNTKLVSGSESHTVTTSWGLSSSQAGAARNPAISRDAHGSSPSPVPSATPVWTNAVAAQPTKKTMKEIQEEEERRKKHAVKETAAAAARRAHAESSTRPPPTQSTSSAWITVGPSSKVATTTPVPGRFPPTAAVTTSAQVNGATSPRPTLVPAAKATQPSPPKADDTPVSPSHEFLKWLNDSLKGLNSSVNLEEIVSMLLSFPMDPDSSTIEIISDLIYANSTVLDGRRFASDFVSRRKVDAASRPKGSGSGNGVGKAVSIADVVKAQPKPTQPEWGGFKVVNKRKKGGRS